MAANTRSTSPGSSLVQMSDCDRGNILDFTMPKSEPAEQDEAIGEFPRVCAMRVAVIARGDIPPWPHSEVEASARLGYLLTPG